MRVVLVPGWHEASGDISLLQHGRHKIDGLEGFGFDCTIFPHGHDGLRDRVDRFARWLDEMKAREPGAFPVATLGYSAGGLVTRGFLRAYPERASEIAATFHLCVPNGGLVSNYVAATMKALFIPNHVIKDLDVASDFMIWLNGTDGRWEPRTDSKLKRWRINGTPWIVPDGHPFLAVCARLPQSEHDSDGVVTIESSTLDGYLPNVTFVAKDANHLNMSGVWNPLTLIFRGWRATDVYWPQVVKLAARFFRGESIER